jgi:molecular chaperone DnaK (HSP70)
MITITEEQRLYGSDSFVEQSKYPQATFGHLQRYLGEKYSEDMAATLRKERYILNEISEDDRGLIGWKIHKKAKDGENTEEIVYTEELIAQLLKYGKMLSERQAGGKVIDCVITIPSYYTPSQKRMMNDAAELAGLSVLQMIHENTAAATMYGVDRMDTEKDHTVLFYNMGGLDTEISIVKYSSILDPQTNKTYEHIEILSESVI